MSLLLSYQQKEIKNYQKVLTKDLNDQYIRTNIKQKMKIEIQQMSVYIVLSLFIQTQMIVQKGIRVKYITYTKVLLRIITSLSMKRTSMTNPLILV